MYFSMAAVAHWNNVYLSVIATVIDSDDVMSYRRRWSVANNARSGKVYAPFVFVVRYRSSTDIRHSFLEEDLRVRKFS